MPVARDGGSRHTARGTAALGMASRAFARAALSGTAAGVPFAARDAFRARRWPACPTDDGAIARVLSNGPMATLGVRAGATTRAPSSSRGFVDLAGRARELRDAARSRLDAARAAPHALREAARSRARANLASLLGPRAAQIVMSRGVDLNPANHARRAAVAARAFAFRHRTPIAVVFGGAATIATWHSSLYAIDFFARGAPRDPAVELATLGLSITFVTLGSRSLRRRAFADPDVVHAAIVRRVENHAGLREVLGAPLRAPSSVVAATSGGEWIWRRRDELACWPRWRAHKIHLAFPLVGTKKTGMVTVEANKVRTGYAYKTIVVDVAANDGGEHRVHLAGGATRRAAAEAIGPSLRAPLEAMLSEAYERERAREEEEEAAAARRAAEDAAEASRPGSLDRGGGMTSAERAWDYVADVAHASRRAAARARDVARGMWASRRRA